MSVSIQQIEFFLVILVRVSAFIFTAPFFSQSNVPRQVKAGFAIAVAIAVNGSVTYTPLEYTSVLSYAIIVMEEAIAGAVMGFFANISQHILAFVGQRIDIDIGFSMATEYDAEIGADITITGNFYNYAVMLMMMVTNLHFYIIQAVVDSFTLIPVGGVEINVGIYRLMAVYLTNYFLLGFRIVLPMYAAILLVDSILGILAKAAPQMNMFAVGIQLKIGVGLLVLYFMVRLLPGVSTMIFEEMFDLLKSSVTFLGG